MELISLLIMMANDGRAYYFSLTAETVAVQTRVGSSLVFDMKAASIVSGVLFMDINLFDPPIMDIIEELRVKFDFRVPDWQKRGKSSKAVNERGSLKRGERNR